MKKQITITLETKLKNREITNAVTTEMKLLFGEDLKGVECLNLKKEVLN